MTRALLSRQGLTFPESRPCLGLHQRAQSPAPAQDAHGPRPGRSVMAVTDISPTGPPLSTWLQRQHRAASGARPRKPFPFLSVTHVISRTETCAHAAQPAVLVSGRGSQGPSSMAPAQDRPAEVQAPPRRCPRVTNHHKRHSKVRNSVTGRTGAEKLVERDPH